MTKLQKQHSERSQACKTNIDLFYIIRLCFLSFKMEDINNETDHNEQQIQNLQNRNYNPSGNSGNISFDNASDLDLH